MKLFLTILFLFFASFAIGQIAYTQKDTTFVTWNARVNYPTVLTDSTWCIITFLGAGEVGVDTSKLALFGPAFYLQSNWNGKIHLGNGDHYPIYITLQAPNQSQKPPAVLTRVNAILARFPLIKKRGLFMTGYSAGGWQSLEFVSYQATSGNHSYALMIPAVLGIESVKPANIFDGTPAYPTNMVQYAQSNGNLLGFDQVSDGGRDMQTYTAAMNAAVAGSANRIVTNFGAGNHCCFNSFYDPTDSNWTATNANVVSLGTGSYQAMTVYQWLLRHGDTTFSNGQTPPSVVGGGGGTITLPTNSKSITSTPSGGVAPYTYSWVKFSGPTTFTINAPTSQNTTVSNLVAGTYDFRITVTDANSLTGSDDVIVIVSPGGNVPPIANAGIDQTITLPTASFTLNGTGSSDPDGTISTYAWSQITGVALNIVSPSTATSVVNGINQSGTYQFQLTVVDNGGATTSDTMQLTVLPNSSGNQVIANIYLYGGTNGCPPTTGLNAWNDSAGLTLNNIVDASGNLTPLTVALSTQTSVVDNGSTYGNGISNLIVPQCQLRHASFQSSGTRTITISGASPADLYTVQVVGSRNSGTANTMDVAIGGTAQSLQTSNNYTSNVNFTNITPNSSGVITLSIVRETGSAGTYINEITIIKQGATANNSPQAFAGQNQAIAAPLDTVFVQGLGTDQDYPDDSVVAYLWQAISGPRLDTLIISSPSSSATVIRNLVVGTYQFQFTVFDTHGASGIDTIQVVVTSNSGAITLLMPKDTTLPLSQRGGHGNDAILDTTQISNGPSAAPNVSIWAWTQVSGPNTGTIASPSSRVTNIYGLIPGLYTFQVKAKNVTDSATAVWHVKVRDYQTMNEHGCRVGAPVTHILNASSTTSMIYLQLYNTRALALDTIRGGDTLKLMPNPNNGGIYIKIDLGGVSGANGCPLIVMSDTVITGAGIFRFGGANDTATMTYFKADFRHPKKRPQALYGLVNRPPAYNPSNNGLVFNGSSDFEIAGVYVTRMGVGSFCKNNADSTHAIQIFNKFRFKNIHLHDCMFDSSGTEMLYWGDTSPNGIAGAGGDGPSTRLDSVEIDHIFVRNSGYDGIQCITATYAKIHDNWILYTGKTNATSQRYAQSVGGLSGLIYNNFVHNCKEGFGGTTWDSSTWSHNFIDSCYDGGSGSGRAAGFRVRGEASGTMAGATYSEQHDSSTIIFDGNLAMNCDSNYFLIHNLANANSINHPSRVKNNLLVDGTGRTLTQLISNSSGTSFNTNNTLFTAASFPVTIVDQSSEANGPLVKVTQGSASQTFGDANTAIQWLMDRLVPPAPPINGFPHLKKTGKVKFIPL